VPDRDGDHGLGRLDAAEQQHARVGDDALALQTAGLAGRSRQQRRGRLTVKRRADRGGQRRVRVATAASQRPTGRDIRHRCHDPVIPAEHGTHVSVLKAERARHDGDRQRPRETAPQLCSAGRLQRVDQPLGLLGHQRREARMHRPTAKRASERVAVAAVLLAVAREHARANHAPRGEARVVDGERPRVAHHLHCEVVPRDEPALQGRQP
jgi:hypothetical protein